MLRVLLLVCLQLLCLGDERDKDRIRAKMTALETALAPVRSKPMAVDSEIYLKAAEWILRHEEEFYKPEYVQYTLDGLAVGLDRAAELARGEASWSKASGRVPRAYRSRVDGSLQPYIMHVPANYDGSKPLRLDVILHGKNSTLTEASFLAGKPLREREYLQMEVFGRTNNAYRWAGETDVFEAIESVRERYNVDPHKIVLRGFSMGGAGVWHIGLHYPDRWAALEAGAGFNETKRYAKLSNLPPYQEAVLPIYDAYLYAHNAVNLPVVGYGGDQDPQLQAALNIKEQLGDLVTRALFLVGPSTGHRFHPDSKKQSDAFIDEALSLPYREPERVRFVTYTTRYNRCHWLSVDGLIRQYDRAEVDARRNDGKIVVVTSNVSAMTLPRGEATVDGDRTPGGVLIREDGKWKSGKQRGLRKIHGLQGPIDDAFLDSFVCVRPTGTPQHPSVHAAAMSRMERFRAEYAKYLRGDIRIKDDREIGEADIAANHLVLFGDPSSNALLRRILAKLPLRWDKQKLVMGAMAYESMEHLPVLIFPNPLNPRKYVVLNTGHTFGAREFKGTNALLFPRLGDYGILKIAGEDTEVAAAGLFDEQWSIPAPKMGSAR